MRTSAGVHEMIYREVSSWLAELKSRDMMIY